MPGVNKPGHRTPQSIEMGRLVEDLTRLARTEQDGAWAEGLVLAYLGTAHIWPLEYSWHEMFLGFAGLDLADAYDLNVAVRITQLLRGTGECDLISSEPGEPSPLRARVEAGEAEDVIELGSRFVLSDESVWSLRLRRRRAAQAIRRCRAA